MRSFVLSLEYRTCNSIFSIADPYWPYKSSKLINFFFVLLVSPVLDQASHPEHAYYHTNFLLWIADRANYPDMMNRLELSSPRPSRSMVVDLSIYKERGCTLPSPDLYISLSPDSGDDPNRKPHPYR